MPVKTPPVVTVPMAASALIHAPPLDVSVSVIGWPTQALDGTMIGAGAAMTPNGKVTAQPPNEYPITTLPVALPLTTPVADPIGAIALLLLLQVPPDVASLSTALPPTQILDGPLTGAGLTLTVTGAVVVQPNTDVYVMMVLPVARPVKWPAASIVPVAGTLLLHVPGVVASARVMPDPWHTCDGPDMTAGNG